MRHVPLLLLTISSIAVAQPKPASPTTFTTATSYQSCSAATVFICGMRDARGNKYGTAKRMDQCTRYTFLPDGTFTTTGDWPAGTGGRYHLRDGTVTLTDTPRDPANPPKPYVLELSKLTLVR